MLTPDSTTNAPILTQKQYAAPTVFRPENLLREARRQKQLPVLDVPPVCVLDPDGDIVAYLVAHHGARVHPGWACYHTQLVECEYQGQRLGVIGRAVGASFAVLLAEQLFASGCALLISITSAGQLVEVQPPPYFILLEKAVRDEGTSYHYLPPAPFSALSPEIAAVLPGALQAAGIEVVTGSSWTTDAPYRETEAAITHYRDQGVLAVEMEAAALYAFAEACQRPVVCFAHVTNQLASIDGDFEKGEHAGSVEALRVILTTARTV